MATSDPIAEIIGDYRAFAAMQRDRLVARGIDIAPYPLSHLAVRVADWAVSFSGHYDRASGVLTITFRGNISF